MTLPLIKSYTIRHLPEEERPRERLRRWGPEALSSVELIAIILGSGTQSKPVLQLAQEILSHFGSLCALADATMEELCSIQGIGPTKALQIKASLSLAARLARADSTQPYRIETPLHAYHLIKDELEPLKQETLVVILQDSKGCVITTQQVAQGTLSQTLVHPREVFYPAIRHKAAALVIAHNHPSGDPTPSPQDFKTTEQLVEAGRLIGIPVQDHLIIGKGCYISLKERGVPMGR